MKGLGFLQKHGHCTLLLHAAGRRAARSGRALRSTGAHALCREDLGSGFSSGRTLRTLADISDGRASCLHSSALAYGRGAAGHIRHFSMLAYPPPSALFAGMLRRYALPALRFLRGHLSMANNLRASACGIARQNFAYGACHAFCKANSRTAALRTACLHTGLQRAIFGRRTLSTLT